MGSRRDLRRMPRTLITNNVVLVRIYVYSIRIDVDAILTLENTSEGVTSVINVQVSVECRGVIENTSMVRADATSAEQMMVLLSATSSLCDCVSIAPI